MNQEFLALQAAVLGRYSLDRELGRGGMGVVFLAREVALERLVAIKLLPPALARRADLRQRFLREARTAARLSHPHIVPIYSVEEHRDLVFFVMGYVDGETCGARVRRAGPIPPHEVTRILREVAWALGHAHSQHIVHRDVKPDNILLERGTGRAMVTDFGIARGLAGDGINSGASGTPQYMAPEQAADQEVDGRADLYALGVTGFFLLTGRLPFESDTAAGFLARHAGEPPPDLRVLAPRVPGATARVIHRLLEKSPADRFASAEELVAALDAGRGAMPDAPAPLRGFIRDVESAGAEMGFLATVGIGALAVKNIFFFGDDFAGLVFYPAATLMVGLAGARLAQVVGRIRDLVYQGYRHAHLRPALAQDAIRRVEEEPPAPVKRSTWRDTAVITAIGAAKTAVFGWIAQADLPIWLNFLGAVGAVVVPAVAVRRIWGLWRTGKPSLWLRLMGSRLGDLLFRVGGLGVRAPAALPPPAEQTELALGAELNDLFDQLPGEVRRRFADLPGLVTRLQSEIQTIRARGEGGDPARMVEAVAALESLRLDLLRLRAGSVVQDELTRDLEAARRIGERIEGVLDPPEPTLPALPTPAGPAVL